MNNETTLYCPKCKNKITVYHLDWCALVCIHCKKEITKNEFLNFLSGLYQNLFECFYQLIHKEFNNDN